MLKKSLRVLFFVGLLACMLVASSLLLVTPASASYCAPICDFSGFCRGNLVAVNWIGPGCTGSEPRCYSICLF